MTSTQQTQSTHPFAVLKIEQLKTIFARTKILAYFGNTPLKQELLDFLDDQGDKFENLVITPRESAKLGLSVRDTIKYKVVIQDRKRKIQDITEDTTEPETVGEEGVTERNVKKRKVRKVAERRKLEKRKLEKRNTNLKHVVTSQGLQTLCPTQIRPLREIDQNSKSQESDDFDVEMEENALSPPRMEEDTSSSEHRIGSEVRIPRRSLRLQWKSQELNQQNNRVIFDPVEGTKVREQPEMQIGTPDGVDESNEGGRTVEAIVEVDQVEEGVTDYAPVWVSVEGGGGAQIMVMENFRRRYKIKMEVTVMVVKKRVPVDGRSTKMACMEVAIKVAGVEVRTETLQRVVAMGEGNEKENLAKMLCEGTKMADAIIQQMNEILSEYGTVVPVRILRVSKKVYEYLTGWDFTDRVAVGWNDIEITKEMMMVDLLWCSGRWKLIGDSKLKSRVNVNTAREKTIQNVCNNITRVELIKGLMDWSDSKWGSIVNTNVHPSSHVIRKDASCNPFQALNMRICTAIMTHKERDSLRIESQEMEIEENVDVQAMCYQVRATLMKMVPEVDNQVMETVGVVVEKLHDLDEVGTFLYNNDARRNVKNIQSTLEAVREEEQEAWEPKDKKTIERNLQVVVQAVRCKDGNLPVFRDLRVSTERRNLWLFQIEYGILKGDLKPKSMRRNNQREKKPSMYEKRVQLLIDCLKMRLKVNRKNIVDKDRLEMKRIQDHLKKELPERTKEIERMFGESGKKEYDKVFVILQRKCRIKMKEVRKGNAGGTIKQLRDDIKKLVKMKKWKKAKKLMKRISRAVCTIPKSQWITYLNKLLKKRAGVKEAQLFFNYYNVRAPRKFNLRKCWDDSITEGEIIQTIKGMNASSTEGAYDGIKVIILKKCDRYIAKMYVNIFNMWRRYPKLVDLLKIKRSVTTMIDKNKDNKQDPNSWRPIKAPSEIYKLYDKLMAYRVMSKIKEKNVFFGLQKGSMNGVSGCNESTWWRKYCASYAKKEGAQMLLGLCDAQSCFSTMQHDIVIAAFMCMDESAGTSFGVYKKGRIGAIVEQFLKGNETTIVTPEGPFPIVGESGGEMGSSFSGLACHILFGLLGNALQVACSSEALIPAYGDVEQRLNVSSMASRAVSVIMDDVTFLVGTVKGAKMAEKEINNFSKLSFTGQNGHKSTLLHMKVEDGNYGAVCEVELKLRNLDGELSAMRILKDDTVLGKSLGFHVGPREQTASVTTVLKQVFKMLDGMKDLWMIQLPDKISYQMLTRCFLPVVGYHLAYTKLPVGAVVELDKVIADLCMKIMNVWALTESMLFVGRRHGGVGIPSFKHLVVKWKVSTLLAICTSNDKILRSHVSTELYCALQVLQIKRKIVLQKPYKWSGWTVFCAVSPKVDLSESLEKDDYLSAIYVLYSLGLRVAVKCLNTTYDSEGRWDGVNENTVLPSADMGMKMVMCVMERSESGWDKVVKLAPKIQHALGMLKLKEIMQAGLVKWETCQSVAWEPTLELGERDFKGKEWMVNGRKNQIETEWDGESQMFEATMLCKHDCRALGTQRHYLNMCTKQVDAKKKKHDAVLSKLAEGLTAWYARAAGVQVNCVRVIEDKEVPKILRNKRKYNSTYATKRFHNRPDIVLYASNESDNQTISPLVWIIEVGIPYADCLRGMYKRKSKSYKTLVSCLDQSNYSFEYVAVCIENFGVLHEESAKELMRISRMDEDDLMGIMKEVWIVLAGHVRKCFVPDLSRMEDNDSVVIQDDQLNEQQDGRSNSSGDMAEPGVHSLTYDHNLRAIRMSDVN